MDNFTAVYKILAALEKAMDYPEMELLPLIGPEKLKVSQARWNCYIEMMLDVGYIKGAEITRYITGEMNIDITDLKITLKGLEYLQENSIMRKVYKTIKGVKDVTPGL